MRNRFEDTVFHGKVNFENTVNGCRVYRAYLVQSGTADPAVTVLENNLNEDIVWTRNQQGIYIGSITETLTLTNTIVFLHKAGAPPAPVNSSNVITYLIANGNVYLYQVTASGSAKQDEFACSIEVRVYD